MPKKSRPDVQQPDLPVLQDVVHNPSAKPHLSGTARVVALAENFNNRIGTAMIIQADLLKKIDNIIDALKGLNARMASQEAAADKRIGELEAALNASQAEAAKWKSQAETGGEGAVALAARLQQIEDLLNQAKAADETTA